MKKLISTVIVIVMALSLVSAASAASFTDVDNTNPYKAAIDYCAEQGYVQGHDNNTFDPNGILTRAQFATVWCRFLVLNEKNHSFVDITRLNNYYDSAVIVLHSLGILKGTDATHFSVNSPMTREQLAVIAMRSLNLGVENVEDYKVYTSDYASIASWARDGVSACVNAKVFEGLYDGTEFKPQQSVTRAELCKLLFNIDLPKYTITVDEPSGGTITVNPASARPGETIRVTVVPANKMQLKAGSLKYDDTAITGTTFVMPAKDVTITAVFETATLTSIAITTLPTKLAYTTDENFDKAGMVVTATYGDGYTEAVTGYVTTPSATDALTEGTTSVSVRYTEGGITKYASFDITVTAPAAPASPEV